jgi:hypothetical protein
MSIQMYARKFPILGQLTSPSGRVELIETIGKGNYGYVYRVFFSVICLLECLCGVFSCFIVGFVDLDLVSAPLDFN